MELEWKQPKWSEARYELIAGEQVLATLEYTGILKRIGHVSYEAERFSFQRAGFWQSGISVRDGEGSEVATCKTGIGGKGTVVFTNGRTFNWVRDGFWSSAWSFVAADNEVVVSFKSAKGFMRTGATVTYQPSSSKYPEIRILTALGWHLMIEAARASAAAAAS